MSSYFNYTGGGGFAPYQSGGFQPYSSPVPDAAWWMQAQLTAKKAYEAAKARLYAQRKSVLNAAGYTARGQIDPKNAVGGIQMMMRGQAQEDQGMRSQFVNRGIQGSGLQGQAAGQLYIQHGSESAQFANQLQQTLGSIQNQIQDAGNVWASSKWQAQQQAAANAIANNQYNNPILPPEAPQQQQQTYGTQVGGGDNINMLNNPAFLDFIRQLLSGGGQLGSKQFLGSGVTYLNK